MDALHGWTGSAGVAQQNSPDTQIIFISGRYDPSVRQTALDAGAFAFLAKPFEDEVLVKLIHEALEGQSSMLLGRPVLYPKTVPNVPRKRSEIDWLPHRLRVPGKTRRRGGHRRRSQFICEAIFRG